MNNRQTEQNLARSRHRFFHDERLPNECFWLTYYNRVVSDVTLAHKDRTALEQWSPVRSNCPELTGVLEDLLDTLPTDWRSLADELFVGRVLDDEVNATAETSRKARTVRITLQYTNVLQRM